MADIAVQLLLCVIYPAVVFFVVTQDLINATLAAPLTLFNVLLGVPNLVITLFNVLLVGVFPSGWVALLVGMVFMVFGLRSYAIIKGAKILGNGI
jgi:hypothetical protein